MDRPPRGRSSLLENRPTPDPQCSKRPSIAPSTAGNPQTQTAARAMDETGELPENTVLNPAHRVQFAIHANALAESFVATLKTECFGDSIPPTKAAAKLMIFDYIESFYNTRQPTQRPGLSLPCAVRTPLALLAARGLFSRRQPGRRDLP